jgi:hypothetical protein
MPVHRGISLLPSSIPNADDAFLSAGFSAYTLIPRQYITHSGDVGALHFNKF